MFEIGDFNTVEEFWNFKNNLPLPSEIFYTQEGIRMKFADRDVEGYSLFKKGIRPEWEDKLNKNGAEIFCRKMFDPRDLDEIYELLCLGLIGETIDPEDEVCGIRIVDKSRGARPMYRVEVWFKRQDEKTKEAIQANVRDCLRRNILTDYRKHSQMLSRR